MVAKAARLVASRDLARGWTSWFEAYLHATARRRLVAAAQARLLRPKLMACMLWWRRDWTATRHMGERQGQAELLAQVRKEARLKDFEQRQHAAVAICAVRPPVSEHV